MGRFTFPAWVNSLVLPVLGLVGLGVLYIAVLIPYAWSPETLVAGYQPEQPVPFSHALHAGEMKIDCRYCHTHVFDSSHSNIPATATCANCHNAAKAPDQTNLTTAVHTTSARLEPVRDGWRMIDDEHLVLDRQRLRQRESDFSTADLASSRSGASIRR
jgi:hypothetical protein